jgi:hypothetical protein
VPLIRLARGRRRGPFESYKKAATSGRRRDAAAP